jgi:hypothetical protein
VDFCNDYRDNRPEVVFVITLEKTVFVEFCLKQGLKLDDVAECIISSNADGTLTIDGTHPAYPHARKGLGDRVADGLAAVGITKERVSKAIGRDCGCKKRQAALNKLGQQTAAAFKRLTGGAHDAETETIEQERRVENRDA